MIETAVNRVIESGILGAVLVIMGWLLFYTVRRFIEFLEKTDAGHVQERNDWRRSLEEHTAASREMYHALQEIVQELRHRNGKT